MSELPGKTPSQSHIDDYVYKIFPNDLNSQGTVFGGTILSLLDRIALVVAERHSEKVCVTVSIDAVHFLAPAGKGDNLIIQACINRSWSSSMEIGLRVMSENTFSKKHQHILSAYFIFVALDSEGKPTKVPPVIYETLEEERRYHEAGHRKERSLKATKEQEAFRKSFSKDH